MESLMFWFGVGWLAWIALVLALMAVANFFAQKRDVEQRLEETGKVVTMIKIGDGKWQKTVA